MRHAQSRAVSEGVPMVLWFDTKQRLYGLNADKSFVEDDPKAAAAMVQHLSSFLRSTLRSSAAQEVPLRDEMDFLASYVAIMKARFEDRLNVAVCVPAELGAQAHFWDSVSGFGCRPPKGTVTVERARCPQHRDEPQRNVARAGK